MGWLLSHAQDEVVLAAPRTAMFLPGRSGVRVFAGHTFETLDAEAKQAQAEAFFRGGMPAAEWQSLKEQYEIRYVLVGPAERAYGGDSDHLRDFTPVFQRGEVSIYHLPYTQ